MRVRRFPGMIYEVYGKKLLWGVAIFLAAIVAFEVFLSFRGGKPIGPVLNAVVVRNLSGEAVSVKVAIDQGEPETIQLPAGKLARIVDAEPGVDRRVITVAGSVKERDGTQTPISAQGEGIIFQLDQNGSGSTAGPIPEKANVMTESAAAAWLRPKFGTVTLEIERPPNR